MSARSNGVQQRATLRVVKIGGSLLTTSAIEHFPIWLQSQPTMNSVLIVGGGSHVEAIRQAQRENGFPDTVAHWQSVAAMTQTAAIVAKRINSTTPIVNDIEQLNEWPSSATVILNVESFLRRDAERTNALPQDWTVTSDSIAARVASELRADELVLLKSTMPEPLATVSSLVESGLVDEHFTTAFASTSLRIVNARGKDWPEHTIGQTNRWQVQILTESSLDAAETDSRSCDRSRGDSLR